MTLKYKILVLLSVGMLTFTAPSCSRKSGCPNLAKPSKKQKKKGTSNLFSKKHRKKARTR